MKNAVTEINHEIAKYRILCAAVKDLQDKYLKKRQEFRQAFEETALIRRAALQVLLKENRLTRHLTGRQRQAAGFTYHLCEIKARLNQGSLYALQDTGKGDDDESLSRVFAPQEDCRDCRELKQKGILLLAVIDDIKKKLLQLDILQLRCREIMLSIGKALEAFRHESEIIHRKIYPFGLFSLFHRTVRSFCGMAYFTLRDMEDIRALGAITSQVLKIADSPVI